MDLEFNKNTIEYLKCAAQSIQRREETGETIVPDSFPDISSIEYVFADTTVRDKECKNGSITISGGIKGGIIYCAEDFDALHKLDFYLPYSIKFENTTITENSQTICTVKVQSVDGRIINSRKAMLRVEISCSLCAYEAVGMDYFDLKDKPDELQTKEEAYCLSLPLDISEKAFSITEDIDIPMNRPPITQIYKFSCKLELSDSKLVGNKGAFKGEAVCKILYVSDDQKLYSYEQRFPFSQYCEFRGDYTDENLEIYPVVSGYDLSAENTEDQRSVTMTLHIMMQAIVYGRRDLFSTADAYSTNMEFRPEWSTYSIESRIDDEYERSAMHHIFNEDVSEIIDTDIYIGHPYIEQKNDKISITTPITLKILAIDKNDAHVSLSKKIDDKKTKALSAAANCASISEQAGNTFIAISHDGIDVRFDLINHNSFFATLDYKTLCGGDLLPDTDLKTRPSMILKRVPKGTSLWDVAKHCRSQMDVILALNDLTGDIISEDQFLLIPVG